MSNARDFASRVPVDGALSSRNMVINGGMTISQRGTSLTNTALNGMNVLDRFSLYLGGSPSKVTFDLSQSTDAPEGFIYSYKVAVNSLGSGTTPITFAYKCEGADTTQLSWGKSSAKPATLSFWVKSNTTGTYAVEFKAFNGSNYYRNVMNYTVNSAGVWEYKTITVSPLTSFLPAYDNTAGVSFEFWLDDSDGAYNSDNTAFGTWVDAATLPNGSRAYGQTAQICDSASNYWQITGIQFEVGDTPTDFEHEPTSVTLQKCRRYYQNVYQRGNSTTGTYYSYYNKFYGNQVQFEPMRTGPTVSYSRTGGAFYWVNPGVTAYSANSTAGFSYSAHQPNAFSMGAIEYSQSRQAGGATPSDFVSYRLEASLIFHLDAEL